MNCQGCEIGVNSLCEGNDCTCDHSKAWWQLVLEKGGAVAVFLLDTIKDQAFNICDGFVGLIVGFLINIVCNLLKRLIEGCNIDQGFLKRLCRFENFCVKKI